MKIELTALAGLAEIKEDRLVKGCEKRPSQLDEQELALLMNQIMFETGTVTVSKMIWFINNASSCSSSCDGRFSHPFTSLSSFISANPASAVNSIFIYQGSCNYYC